MNKDSIKKEIKDKESIKSSIKDIDVKLSLGDITEYDVDVIVNAANKGMIHGGGVCGAIYNAVKDSGLKNYDKLIEEVNSLPFINESSDRLNFGNVKYTTAPGLKSKYIFHTVGPMSDIHNEKEQYEIGFSCFFQSLLLADKLKLKSIAFCFIGTGIYGCSKFKYQKLLRELVLNL